MADEQNKGAGEAGEHEFSIQRIYLKDLSFESPASPAVFLQEWRPELNMDLNTKSNSLGDNNHEVILTVSVNVKMGDKTVFLVEVQQAGIFTMKGFSKEEEHPMLGSFCPNVLYPYARQAITNAVVSGGFPQLYLAPVNFDALYQQHQQSQVENKSDA